MNAFTEQDYSKEFSLKTWREIFRFALPFRKNMLYMIVLMVSIAGIDSITPLFTRWIIDHVIVPRHTSGLLPFAFIYGAVIVSQALIIWQFITQAGRVEMGICYEIRKAGFRRLQELSFSFYDRTPVGWIMARMTSDTQKLGEVIAWGMIDMTWGTTMMAGLAVIMLIVNWKLALVTLSVVPLLVVMSIFFQRRILERFRLVRKINSRITASFNEGIMGGRTTKTLVREEANLRDFRMVTGEMRDHSIRAAILSALFLPAVLTFGTIGTALALWSGGSSVIAGTLTYGTLVAFVFASIQFFDPIMELSRVIADVQYAQASAERVISLVNTEPEIRDSHELLSAQEARSPTGETEIGPVQFEIGQWPQMRGDVTFSNVSFAYKGGEKVLDNFSLEIKAGQRVALVGETGSGKSTIVNLACRFYEPTNGNILIDGVDYRNRPLLWLHSNLGYVLQSPHLFSGTIAENIRYGNLEASDQDVVEAAKLVDAHKFITRLEQGYETQTGEGGGRLSTGEKQLISFARAIIADPRLFVLDEATSSIDTETEQLIQKAIERVLENRTSFIVAHRLSTIRSADRILVLRKGRVTEEGTHEELLRLRGYYYRLYTNQFMEEEGSRLIN
ncbi:MAG TPA: ABC transporter ATP-binding protein [Spirochaetia bacterium]|nr:ABC transporter ATP-binding protein [Spirochaetia bacterium]